MSAHSRNIEVTGSNFVAIPGGNSAATVRNPAFEKLQKASAPNALHNASTLHNEGHCRENTHVAVMDYLMGWLFGPSDPQALILWLYGPPESGKTALLQTITQQCLERQILHASFFFDRTDSTRNTYKPLTATIAYQLAATIPEIKPALERIIEHDPLIFEQPFATQLRSLIVEPLKDLTASGFFDDPNNCTRLIILIDGLEACNDPHDPYEILHALANVLRGEKLPLVFLISSTPEQRVMLAFNTSPLAGIWRSLVLHNRSEANEPIRLYLLNSFRVIKTTHPRRHLIPMAWPLLSDIDKIIQKSSGLFIYASMVAMYVAAPVDYPPRRLEVVMGLRPMRCDFPLTHLDDLYMHILGSCHDPAAVLDILGLVYSGIVDIVDHIEILLDLEPGDMEAILAPLASLISLESVVDPDVHPSQKRKRIELYHVSFGDFLGDATRSGPFHIRLLTYHEKTVSRCLRK
ncbi:hypothetical protein BJ912DRAFT_233111 [Pholiota molesta]|nr:hypothetical protein BJ912DRAFT_233111 [Pholiota molesta]